MPRMQMYESRSQKCSTEEILFQLSMSFAGIYFDGLACINMCAMFQAIFDSHHYN